LTCGLRRSGAALVAVLLCLSLASCGEEGAEQPGGAASDPASESAAPSEPPSSDEPTAPPLQDGPIEVTGDAGVEKAVVVSGSEVGGDVSPLAFPLETQQEQQDFGASFNAGFDADVGRAVRSLGAPAGTLPWGTVAAVGCEGPTSVRIDAGEAGFEVTPQLPKSTVQCLVPVTYVVVFAAPAVG
jgi:hypothetical protein